MRIQTSKAVQLISVLFKDPLEFGDRVSMVASYRTASLAGQKPKYTLSEWDSVVENLGKLLGHDVRGFLDEAPLRQVEAGLEERAQQLPADSPFGRFHDGDLALARLCYITARALEPDRVIETGVCYGVTSFFVLSALERNRRGRLDSIDLPPLGRDGDRLVGWMIPDGPLKERWRLSRGLSRRLLPKILLQPGSLSIFIHDSLHSYSNMKYEFDLVWPRLRPGGVFIADDIEGNAAFLEWSVRKDVAFHAAIQELNKKSLLGILVKSS